MGIKLKNFSRHIITKIVLFVLCAVLVGAAGTSFYSAAFGSFDFSGFANGGYSYSERHYDDIYDAVVKLMSGDTSQLDEKCFYYINSRGKVLSNSTDKSMQFFTQYPYSYVWENEEATGGYEAEINCFGNLMHYQMGADKSTTLYIAFKNEYIAEQEKLFETDCREISYILSFALAFAVLFLVCLIWLCAVSGRSTEDDNIHTGFSERIYTEVHLLALFLVPMFWVALIDAFFEVFPARITQFNLSLVFVLTALCAAGEVAVFLSIVRKLKAGLFVRQSLTYKILHIIYMPVSDFITGKRFSKNKFWCSMVSKNIVFIPLEFVSVLIFLVNIDYEEGLSILAFMAGAALFLFYLRSKYRACKDVDKIIEQIHAISQGDLTAATQLSPKSELCQAAVELNNIGSGLQKSLAEQIKGERMKIDLVTNVSHDLKTPLTSIIGYIDLMKKEEGLSPEMNDYVNVLSNKAERLKTIVADLFDLAKSTSGNAEVETEKLNICKLIIQTMVDMEDKITAYGREIKTSLPEEAVYILADGKKLYRVFQNIIDNALKYSMEGTRIFIELSVENGKVYVIIKNTASYPMNFTAEEILERFARGDKARTTQGSGLGLSIAESFTNVCGGSFYVVVDGDQFKTSVVFNLFE